MEQGNVSRGIKDSMTLNGVDVTFFMMPNGEKRVAIEDRGPPMGLSNQIFYNRTKNGSKALKDLKSQGFRGEQKFIEVAMEDAKGNSLGEASVPAKTISLGDFTKFVGYEALKKKNSKAIILLLAFAQTGIEQAVDALFEGRSIEFLLENIVHYSQWTYEDLEEVLQYNRDELAALYF